MRTHIKAWMLLVMCTQFATSASAQGEMQLDLDDFTRFQFCEKATPLVNGHAWRKMKPTEQATYVWAVGDGMFLLSREFYQRDNTPSSAVMKPLNRLSFGETSKPEVVAGVGVFYSDSAYLNVPIIEAVRFSLLKNLGAPANELAALQTSLRNTYGSDNQATTKVNCNGCELRIPNAWMIMKNGRWMSFQELGYGTSLSEGRQWKPLADTAGPQHTYWFRDPTANALVSVAYKDSPLKNKPEAKDLLSGGKAEEDMFGKIFIETLTQLVGAPIQRSGYRLNSRVFRAWVEVEVDARKRFEPLPQSRVFDRMEVIVNNTVCFNIEYACTAAQKRAWLPCFDEIQASVTLE